ncbi:hypothetical protein ACFYN3_40730 [Streptomyces lavendulae]|uniref:hypothetical protein n=1 Tax=Streptomyces lavendulae TaxID=1914 RepID=UPI003697FD73
MKTPRLFGNRAVAVLTVTCAAALLCVSSAPAFPRAPAAPSQTPKTLYNSMFQLSFDPPLSHTHRTTDIVAVAALTNGVTATGGPAVVNGKNVFSGAVTDASGKASIPSGVDMCTGLTVTIPGTGPDAGRATVIWQPANRQNPSPDGQDQFTFALGLLDGRPAAIANFTGSTGPYSGYRSVNSGVAITNPDCASTGLLKWLGVAVGGTSLFTP